ncbi:MAG: hypothetical protein QOI24_2674 [Acidobacteriota bacterium]|nr:hypothetical protein [Acidobacteriota bacterium]
MKIFFVLGLMLLVLGIASLFIPIPHRQTHGFKAGGIEVGVQTTESEKVHPGISAALILGGVALLVVGGRKSG